MSLIYCLLPWRSSWFSTNQIDLSTCVWFGFIIWISFPIWFPSCGVFNMIWLAFRANSVNALQQLPQIRSARARLDASSPDFRSQWLDGSLQAHVNIVSHFLYRERDSSECVHYGLSFMEIVQTAVFICPYFEQHYFYEESTEVTTIKRKHLVCISLNSTPTSCLFFYRK